MTWGELKTIMIDFGFEEESYLIDPMAASEFRSSVNEARRIISQYVPLIGRYDFTQDGTATGLHRINLKTGKENNTEGQEVDIVYDGMFDKMDSFQIIVNGQPFPFSDYTIEQGCIVVLNYAIKGDFTIFYAKSITPVTVSTEDDFDLQMDYEVEHLLPLLASYHAWLDDDIQKATMYYNEYEQEMTKILERRAERNNKVKARIVGGVKWH